MWLTTPSFESVTRPRLAVAIVYAAIAAASVGYYAYVTAPRPPEFVPGQGLHRSNAVRRTRRPRPSRTQSSSSSEVAGDENIDINPAEPIDDSETFIGDGEDGWWDDPTGLPGQQRAGHNIVNLLFRVSEDNARRNGCVHRGCQCNSCGMAPIRGVRYRCVNCADFDLCETCESQGVHTKAHIFYKIKVPVPPFSPRQMQPVWYTGDPDNCRRNLPKSLLARLTKDTGFERPELEAFWEQWTFMANTEWRNDPDELFLAMDRKTFERCLVPTGGSKHAAPNLIHDRMFAFYDLNNDGFIGFYEFLAALSYRKRKDKLRKVFEGYDLDGDGLVSRKDFLRMFRAYYVVYKQMHRDILDGLEDQLISSVEAQQLVASRQPLSSLFGREGGIPRGDASLRFEGKTINRDGSVDVEDEHQGPVAENQGDTSSRQDILTSLFACETDQRSRWRTLARAAAGDDLDQPRHSRLSDADRPYLVTLLEPPGSLDELPDAIMGQVTLELDEETSEDDEDAENDEPGPQNDIEAQIRAQNYSRRHMSRMEKRRRDMARSHLHDRWKRRQFYLDEEEGGEAPDDWETDEDILPNGVENGESSKAPLDEDIGPPSEPYVSSSTRFGPESWGPFVVPEPERDAGREILYQVTQQAFNELLDIIFKEAEDTAVKARETREQRLKHKDAIDALVMPQSAQQGGFTPTEGDGEGLETTRAEAKVLDDLLTQSGYSIIPEHPPAREENGSHSPENLEAQGDANDEPEAISRPALESPNGFDPTLPQFRPDSMTWDEMRRLNRVTYPITHPSASRTATEAALTYETLLEWKKLTAAEELAKDRGGWGKLTFTEFEKIYRRQEDNRLDYLGSWIDFCIP